MLDYNYNVSKMDSNIQTKEIKDNNTSAENAEVYVDFRPVCQNCGLKMHPTGTCYTCPSCGNSSGACQ